MLSWVEHEKKFYNLGALLSESYSICESYHVQARCIYELTVLLSMLVDL